MSPATGRISALLSRFLDSDERVICGCCDERFAGRAAGISHVVACHPEYAATCTNAPIDHPWTPASEPPPAPPLGATRPFMPVWG
jgi:hypothetical protein